MAIRRLGNYYGRIGWWHPNGWVLWPDGDTSAWPEDLTAPDAAGMRWSYSEAFRFRPYLASAMGGHLYAVLTNPELSVSGGYLMNDRLTTGGRINKGEAPDPNNHYGWLDTRAYNYEFHKVEPSDGRGMVRWRLVAVLKAGVSVAGLPDPKTGRTYPAWPRVRHRKRK